MNIWKIRNRWLRAGVSWVLAGVVAVAVLALLPLALVWIVVTSARAGLVGAWRGLVARAPEWRDDVFLPLWRALTLKENA